MRKLASIRTIDAITPIEGADAIECVTIGGWKCVAKKGEFKVGARCVYFEVDSILPASDERYKFLEKSFKEFHTEAGSKVLGHRLKTIKLRGQISQTTNRPMEHQQVTQNNATRSGRICNSYATTLHPQKHTLLAGVSVYLKKIQTFHT
jgi:RNA ligase (TIGR02306 family)